MRKPITALSAHRVIALVIALSGFVNLASGLAPMVGLAVNVGEVPAYLRMTRAEQTSAFVAIFLGLVLLLLGKGLYERRRPAWWGTLFVLGVLAANNLLGAPSAVSGALCLVLMVGLIAFRSRFNRVAPLRVDYGQVVALAAVIFALAYGIVGSYIMREQFRGIATWGDAVYYTVITYSTVGYGDITPATPNSKVFALSMVVVGVGSFLTAVTVLVGPIIERRMRGVLKIMAGIQKLSDHVVVCGLTNVSESILDELRDRGVSCLVVEERRELIELLRGRGVDVLAGNPAESETLGKANLRQARAIIAARDSDSDNMLIAVTARDYRKQRGGQFRILVRVEDEENVEKVRSIGADEAISPSTMGGRMLAVHAVEEGEGG